MTISSETTVVEYSGNGSSSQKLAIPFYIPEKDAVYVWSIDSDGVLTRRYLGEYYEIEILLNADSSGNYGYITPVSTFASGLTIRIHRLIEMTQQHEVIENSSHDSIERMLDYVTVQNQQIIGHTEKDYRHWDAKNMKISNLATPTNKADIANRDYVKTKIGESNRTGGTWTIGSSDVGKYATSNSLNSLVWTAFSGYPDPYGQWHKYLTPNGWKEFTEGPAANSNDNYLLMDVSGTPTWSQIYDLPNPGATTAYNVLERTNGSTPATFNWRTNGFMPTGTPQEGQLVCKHGSEGRNIWSDKRLITGKTPITFSGDFTGVTGSSGSHGTIESHRVWQGTLEYAFGATPTCFFAIAEPRHVAYNHPTAYWFSPNSEGTQGESNFGACPTRYTYNIADTVVININSLSSTSIDLSATSMFHKYAWTGSDVENLYDFPSSFDTLVTWMAIVPEV